MHPESSDAICWGDVGGGALDREPQSCRVEDVREAVRGRAGSCRPLSEVPGSSVTGPSSDLPSCLPGRKARCDPRPFTRPTSPEGRAGPPARSRGHRHGAAASLARPGPHTSPGPLHFCTLYSLCEGLRVRTPCALWV